METKSIKKTLYMPLVKDVSSDKLLGILSSNVVDREEEVISEALLKKWADTKALPALTDHENEIAHFAGGWKNFRTEKINGMTALVAEPVFFKSNPNTSFLEAMVREAKDLGLPFGISIGAMVSAISTVTIDNEDVTQWDDAELLEASWVAIPANQTAGIKSLTKSFELKSIEESDLKELQMEKKENTVKAVEKKEETKVEVKTFTLDEVKSLIADEISSAKKEFEESAIKSESVMTEKVTDAIAEALKNMEASKKSVAVAAEKELDITNLTNG